MSRLTSAKPTEVEEEVSHTGSENPVDGRGRVRDAIGVVRSLPQKKVVCFCASSRPRIIFPKLPFFGSKHHRGQASYNLLRKRTEIFI